MASTQQQGSNKRRVVRIDRRRPTEDTSSAHERPNNRLVAWLQQRSGLSIALIAGGLYVALAQYVLWLNDPVRNGAGFWPAAGLTVAMLLMLPANRWPWVLGAVWIGELVGDLLLGYPTGASVLWAVGNTVEPLIGAALVRRFADWQGRLLPLRNFGWFVLAAVVLGPLVGASIGSLGTVAFVRLPALTVWPKYVVGDALGVLVVAPILLTIGDRSARRSMAERLSLASALLLTTFLVFRPDAGTLGELPHLVLPLLVWAALRFGVRAAAWAVFVVGQSANVATAFGAGPFFMPGASNEHAITLLQVFLLISGGTAFVVASMSSDLAARAEAEARLAFQARHDLLTGLPNRRAMREQLQITLESLAQQHEPMALLFCDLDGLKKINDQHGHAWGDAILVEAAARLRLGVRPSDLVARFGGDEFVILCHRVENEADSASIAQRMLTELKRPYAYQGQSVALSGSVGVVVTGDSTMGVAGLLGAADEAMYRAKQRGGGGIEVTRLGNGLSTRRGR